MSTEVQVALYDLSMGMARNLSAQFLGPAHAVDMIPHTAILAFGQEYFFGQGIEWCSPMEFRQSRGIHPVEVKTLGRTARSRQEFEDWCRAQAVNGRFGMQSYDFFHNNCNNFTETAAREGLGVNQGVDPWILELPQKFLQSPMGMIVRPMLESMQMNNAPTNVPSHHFASEPAAASSAPAPSAAAASNPWANISASTPPVKHSTPDAPKTNLLEKQTALLSTDSNVVKVCIDRLKPEPEQTELLSKLADTNASWTQEQISAVHQYLRTVIESAQNVPFALMLLRLVVLRQPADKATATSEESTQSGQLVASLIIEEKLSSLANRSMAWCVLSNAVGSAQPPNWKDVEGHTLIQVIEKALSDCDPSKDGASSPTHASLRQSAAAFLYNSSIYLTVASDESGDMSDCMMSILLGCLEHIHEQKDATTIQRMYMAVGQLLKSKEFGETAVELVKDLGLLDGEIATGKGHKEVEGLAREVAALLE
ncbi:hypothetical protein ACHAXT_004674 [Thalassiosira profunda]